MGIKGGLCKRCNEPYSLLFSRALGRGICNKCLRADEQRTRDEAKAKKAAKKAIENAYAHAVELGHWSRLRHAVFPKRCLCCGETDQIDYHTSREFSRYQGQGKWFSFFVRPKYYLRVEFPHPYCRLCWHHLELAKKQISTGAGPIVVGALLLLFGLTALNGI